MPHLCSLWRFAGACISPNDREVGFMAISYNGLWKLLIDKNLKKVDLTNKYGISSSTIAKMSKGKTVSMDIMERLCKELDCDFGDIIHYIGDKDDEKNRLQK